ncbi:MAG: TIGR01212 family radical SAM protein [Desulfuromonadales bacterium]|nr:TIGR01212 family radical SAM protein [Desulfuromonadales bacterium]
MDSKKRFNSFSEELKRIFGCRVHRISIDAGFTCPNRDGSLGNKGCVFCSERGSGSFAIARGQDVATQIELGKEVMVRKYKAEKFIAYFQSYSNTYAPVKELDALYSAALSVSDVVGLIVGTRPDCLSPDVLTLLSDYNRRTEFWLELGLQSPYDRTLEFIGRGHDVKTFVNAVGSLKPYGIRVCVHIILGLPGESREEMLATASFINSLGIDGIKIHMLHISRDTPLAELYEKGGVKVFERDEYVDLVCDFLERLNPNIFIHRLTGDGGKDLIAPKWSAAKFEVLNEIDWELERRNTMQGALIRL